MVTWIVQSNLIKEDTLEDISKAAKNHGHDCVGLKIIPFSEGTEWSADIGFKPPEGSLVVYGSTSMIKMVARSKWNKDGFFFNQENLKTSKWIEKLGTRMLNHDAKFMTLKEAMNIGEGQFFMKPDDDLKDFTGSDVDAAGIAKFYDSVSAGGFLFSTDIRIVLSSLKNTGWEYRCFMVDDKVISASSYKLKSMLRQDKRVPKEVIDFAEETARIWRPDDVHVLDVVETDDGLKVVEFNCFNASGFYANDIDKIVAAVSKKVEEKCSTK